LPSSLGEYALMPMTVDIAAKRLGFKSNVDVIEHLHHICSN
jgi:hypothetical protein